MTIVKNILKTKGNEIYTVGEEMLVFDALALLAQKNIGALLVMEGDRLRGIFSERDYARKVVLRGESSRQLIVKDIMTVDVITVTPEQSLEECMTLMTTMHIRHLPVVSQEKVIGLISIGDIVKAIISHQQDIITHLENYITGKR